jgi:hypothetical protein
VAQEFISFKNCSMESEKYVCIRETGAQNQVVIVDMAAPMSPARRQITADSALMCLDKKVIALKATTAGTPGDALQVFNLDTKTKLKAHQMPEPVEFWKWISATQLGLVTATSVYHWDIEVRCTAAALLLWVVLAVLLLLLFWTQQPYTARCTLMSFRGSSASGAKGSGRGADAVAEPAICYCRKTQKCTQQYLF